MLESIQRVERLASCVQRLRIFTTSAKGLTLNTAALGGLRELEIIVSRISEIKIDWKSKEKEDLLCNSSPYFKHLSNIAIYDLEGPKELTWLLFAPYLKHLKVEHSPSLEEIINKGKRMIISNVHPDMRAPFGKLASLSVSDMDELKRMCSSPPPVLPSLRKFVVEDCPKLPKAANFFHISLTQTLTQNLIVNRKKTTVDEHSSSSVSAAVQLRQLQVSWSANIDIILD
ncbi:hypothetical protein F2Q68_00043508 [Brassica cretica]|uniref:NB-ARC domain-containing protein n=1 Tax=Brassica cretica TaxID=69181 RepID=A0A8S9LRI2_BRACR|nr:hypothetical protein F2Q68_00043508 [Brassica cretica]